MEEESFEEFRRRMFSKVTDKKNIKSVTLINDVISTDEKNIVRVISIGRKSKVVLYLNDFIRIPYNILKNIKSQFTVEYMGHIILNTVSFKGIITFENNHMFIRGRRYNYSDIKINKI